MLCSEQASGALAPPARQTALQPLWCAIVLQRREDSVCTMKLAAKIVLLACIALTLALCAFADSDPWADGASASSKSKKKGAPGSTEDDTMHANGEEDEEPPGFIERHAMVIMYVVIMAVNKLIRSFLAKKEQGASGEPGGLVKAVHSEAEWKEFVEESKRTNQLVRDGAEGRAQQQAGACGLALEAGAAGARATATVLRQPPPGATRDWSPHSERRDPPSPLALRPGDR